MKVPQAAVAVVAAIALSLSAALSTPAQAGSSPRSESADTEYSAAVAPLVWVVVVAVAREGGKQAVRKVVARGATQKAARQRAGRAVKEAGEKVVKVTKVTQSKMKKFTARNLRHNLAVRTGHTKIRYQAHHRFPQKYRTRLSKHGIKQKDVDNPRYALWWCASSHRKLAYAYNEDWRLVLDRADANPKKHGGRQNMLKQMDRLTRKYSSHYACPPGTAEPLAVGEVV